MQNIKKVYELVIDGETIQTEDKCREGLENIYNSVEDYLEGGCYLSEFQISVYYSEYDELGFILNSELVEDFELTETKN
tara:strand:- start:8335 stop:8571 length:237 start_codon:yes stop_codon:yes gene_type:complete